MPTFSRRSFTGALGAGLGATLMGPRLLGSAALARPRVSTGGSILLDSNENPYGPSPAALAAMTHSQARAARYPDAIEREVAEALARDHGVAPEQIVLGCGSGEILRMADMAFLSPGKTVLAAEPTFEAVLMYARVTKAEGVKVPLDAEHRHDLAKMAAACDAKTGLVYVCNPNNPTGTVVSGDALGAFLPRVPKTAVVLVDEAYHHFVEDPGYRSASEWLSRTPNLVVVRTFSKVYGLAGMRLGYAVASLENARALREHQIFSNANGAVLEAALISLQDPAHVADQRRRNRDTRAFVCAELSKDGRRFIPSETNFLMIDVGRDVVAVIDALRSRNVLVGRKFPSLANWLRVSIGTPAEMETFLAALRAVLPLATAVAGGPATAP
ncbi:MAG TPA: histidinol-phosphate transaminase [Vicinamibacteria bacterium]|jgi:histidinol-phosphate aminotransferase|nr:histidinol-phosphate transaminase [Vicinamibacteria bacterium]